MSETVETMPGLSNDEIVAAWVEGRAFNTATKYRHAAKCLREFTDKPIRELTPTDLQRFSGWLKGRFASSTSATICSQARNLVLFSLRDTAGDVPPDSAWGTVRKRKPPEYQEKGCTGCGQSFTPTGPGLKLCPTCYERATHCKECGVELSDLRYEYCSTHAWMGANLGTAPCAECGVEFTVKVKKQQWCEVCGSEHDKERRKKRADAVARCAHPLYRDLHKLGRTCKACPDERPNEPPNPIADNSKTGLCRSCAARERWRQMTDPARREIMQTVAGNRERQRYKMRFERLWNRTDELGRFLLDLIGGDNYAGPAAAAEFLNLADMQSFYRWATRTGNGHRLVTSHHLRTLAQRLAHSPANTRQRSVERWAQELRHVCTTRKAGGWGKALTWQAKVKALAKDSRDPLVRMLAHAINDRGLGREGAAAQARVTPRALNSWLGIGCRRPMGPQPEFAPHAVRVLLEETASPEHIQAAVATVTKLTTNRQTRIKNFKRGSKRGRQEGSSARSASAAEDRMKTYWPTFERYAARGQDPHALHNWGKVIEEAGGSRHTAITAYNEWVASKREGVIVK